MQTVLNCDVSSHINWTVDWHTLLTDTQLQALLDDGWIVLDKVFDDSALQALQLESGYITYREATLTDGERLPDVRGDYIRWIGHPNKPTLPIGDAYLQAIDGLADWLNQQFFAGIRHSEAHYACYPKGYGYDWHTDNPQDRDERVFSAVFYLNDGWTAEDGGALEVIDLQGQSATLLPKANRLVLFVSDLRHQVQIAHRERYSIATWLRRDDVLPFV